MNKCQLLLVVLFDTILLIVLLIRAALSRLILTKDYAWYFSIKVVVLFIVLCVILAMTLLIVLIIMCDTWYKVCRAAINNESVIIVFKSFPIQSRDRSIIWSWIIWLWWIWIKTLYASFSANHIDLAQKLFCKTSLSLIVQVEISLTCHLWTIWKVSLNLFSFLNDKRLLHTIVRWWYDRKLRFRCSQIKSIHILNKYSFWLREVLRVCNR